MNLRPRHHTVSVDLMATSPVVVNDSYDSCLEVSSASFADDASRLANEPESDSSLEEPEFNSTYQTTRRAAVQEANRLLLSATRLMMKLALQATHGQVQEATVALHCELLDILGSLGAQVGKCV